MAVTILMIDAAVGGCITSHASVAAARVALDEHVLRSWKTVSAFVPPASPAHRIDQFFALCGYKYLIMTLALSVRAEIFGMQEGAGPGTSAETVLPRSAASL